MRLISKDALIEKVEAIMKDRVFLSGDKILIYDLLSAIGTTPALDAELVKHGRYIFEERAPFGANVIVYSCSECGARIMSEGSPQDNYCRKCGAKMDNSKEAE